MKITSARARTYTTENVIWVDWRQSATRRLTAAALLLAGDFRPKDQGLKIRLKRVQQL